MNLTQTKVSGLGPVVSLLVPKDINIIGLSYLLTLKLTQKDDVRNKLDINVFNVTFHLLFVSILVI